MSGKRAEGMGTYGLPIHEDLWNAAKKKANDRGDGSIYEIIRDFLRGYADHDERENPHAGYVVTLTKGAREGNTKATLDAIRMIKGVTTVHPHH